MSKEEDFDETQDPLTDNESEEDEEEILTDLKQRSSKKKSIKQIDDDEDENDEQEDDIFQEQGEEDDDDLSELSDLEDNQATNQEKSNLDSISNLELTNNLSQLYDEDIIMEKYNDKYKQEYIINNHPECLGQNINEVKRLTSVIRDNNNNIVDEFHKTNPFLTKYELTRVLGQRTKQINSGSQTFVEVPPNVLDGYIIAEKELLEKKLPFIIQRPLPGGGQEYWHLKDLEILGH